VNASTTPDPSACGTCCTLSASGRPIEHDECSARAVLLEAPDQPSYEALVDLTEEQRAALPARFHTPWFDRDGTPNAWLCRVCWGDGWVTRWPCKTAVQHGTAVFTSDADAERTLKVAAAEVERLRARVAELEAEAGDGHTRTVNEDPLPIALTQPTDVTASQWATAINTAGLRPGPALAARYVTGEYDAAVHIATSPMLTDDARQELIEELGTAVYAAINRVLRTRTVRTTSPAPLTQLAHEVPAERKTPRLGDREDRYDSPLHTTYATPHDLPEPGVTA
jgi:hypothetical protein